MNLSEKLRKGIPLRVLFVNDIGFQFGAGIGMMRQIQAFLGRGDTVMLLCCQQGEVEGNIRFDGPGDWLGTQSIPQFNYRDKSQVLTPDFAVELLLLKAAAAYPDVVIFGNLHGKPWPVRLLPAMRRLAPAVIAYMHDCWYVTGRCAYPGECTKYASPEGCDDKCPTPHEYPQLNPSLIHAAWQERRAIFGGPHGIPLVANSDWTLQFARNSIPDLPMPGVVHLSLDTNLFKPGDKAAARRALGIPEGKLIVTAGAVNLTDERKGGKYLQTIFNSLPEGTQGVVFGHNSHVIKGVIPIALQRDQSLMPLVFQASDVFVNTAVTEAFGMTVMEASACGVPTCAFRVGGITEIARDGQNARLATLGDVNGLLANIKWFRDNPEELAAYGRRGREIVETDFSIQRHGENWGKYLMQLADYQEGLAEKAA
ncbi:hypothetical protein DB346_19825 [Verrucomicrobia bacterium LW23]|nr:hypothetical protein DB346_19825 [Verrucomicrobia bacterium LW23]